MRKLREKEKSDREKTPAQKPVRRVDEIFFLRIVAKEMGISIDPALKYSAWEMTDVIVKEIHLTNLKINNLNKAAKRQAKLVAGLKQLQMPLEVKNG